VMVDEDQLGDVHGASWGLGAHFDGRAGVAGRDNDFLHGCTHHVQAVAAVGNLPGGAVGQLSSSARSTRGAAGQPAETSVAGKLLHG
jgi:hypothetical protein